jgi:translation initiation factor IF-1
VEAVLKMPGLSVHSAQKNMSKSKRSALRKNTNRVDAAIRGVLEGVEYGKVLKEFGNKTFLVANTAGRERQAHIRGKMARISVGDFVLLSIREYESRAGSEKEVYDIMAQISNRDASKLVKSGDIPSWMIGGDADGDELFDYTEGAVEDIDEEDAKKGLYEDVNIDEI